MNLAVLVRDIDEFSGRISSIWDHFFDAVAIGYAVISSAIFLRTITLHMLCLDDQLAKREDVRIARVAP